MKVSAKIICIIAILLILTSCGTGNISEPASVENFSVESSSVENSVDSSVYSSLIYEDLQKISLILDSNYENGFAVKGLGGDQGTTATVGTFNYLNVSGRPFWSLAQWTSKYDFMDQSVTTFKELGEGIFRYINPTKEFTVDTKNAILTFGGIASNCYDSPRASGSDSWFHILIESTFSMSGNNPDTNVSELKAVKIKLSSKLTKFEDKMDGQADPGLHAAQFLMYLNIQNQDVNDPGYGEMIWLGLPIFDNRYEWLDTSAMYDNGTGAMMYGIGNKKLYMDGANFFDEGAIVAGETSPWIQIDVDVLNDIKIAYEIARYRGYFKDTDFEELYISGMNIGWEIPGVYDAEMQVKDLSVDVYK